MTTRDVAQVVERERYAGIFVGGSTEWKRETASTWCALAHERGLEVHIGRVGTPALVAWARDVGADSIDSCFPLWHADHLQDWLGALGLA